MMNETKEVDNDEKRKKRREKRQERKRKKKRELMKQIIRNQRKRARDREKAKIDAALKLQRMQKARAHWLQANNMDEEMLMKVNNMVDIHKMMGKITVVIVNKK